MKTFEVIDISGDAGIRVYGDSIQELFVNAAIGLYSLITDQAAVREERSIVADVRSHSPEGLLVSWLNELIFHFDTYGFVGKTIRVARFLDNCIVARVSGEDFDPERHERRLLIKAATYHRLSIVKREGLWVTDVIFDI